MSRAENQRETPAWSAPLVVGEVPPQGADVVLEADASERDRLAQLNGLVALSSAAATLHATRRGREGLHVTGEVRARLTQTCVVSLEDFESEIVESIDVEFEPARAKPVRDEGERMSRRRRDARPPVEEDEEGMDDLDAPDEIVDGRVDLGALAAEFLTLGIDPYPRKPGVAFAEPKAQGATISPFARLAERKEKPDDKG